ncbi:MAG: MBL fold metallo-hydrolase [Clostridiales bacterium]|nr:MBL fold metallo-hydrolase [Clostridiales bacterium]
MKLTFLGATHEVTGSSFYLEACGRHILIDCGMEQGRDLYENQELPISAAEVDTVLLTHAHMDHSGNLPLLYAEGFRGKIHSTGATEKLCDIMLQDSAHIQMFEAEWQNRKRKRKGQEPFIPVYTMEDALSTIKLFSPHRYNEKFNLYEGIEIRFTDVGHLLGSASIEVWITEEGVTKKIVFSGDIGNLNQPLIRNPQYIDEADYVVMETTYGTRNHGESPNYIKELTEVIQSTFDKGGNLVIPSFAIGRTQVLLYFIRKIKADGLIKGFNNFKVYVDSPLAIEATEIYNENMIGHYDEESMKLVQQGINPISFPGLKTAVTADESKAINFDKDCKIIISASGMCDAGRIRHHLKHNLWRNESTILFVGHQSPQSLGDRILNGATEVKLFGENILVNANVHKLSGMSGHADKDGLLTWLGSYKKKPEKVFLVHGDPESITGFSQTLKERDYDIYAPFSGAVYDLKENNLIQEGVIIKVQDKEKQSKSANVYERLVSAGQRLMVVITKSKGTNKDISKFTSQINSLSDKWEK